MPTEREPGYHEGWYCRDRRGLMAVDKVDRPEDEGQQVEIVRPRRAVVSEEEALQRMEEFPAQRKEKLIAAVRKVKG
jgi:phage replication-related protein YjqB (UPF0714/DUF867 family)